MDEPLERRKYYRAEGKYYAGSISTEESADESADCRGEETEVAAS